VTRALSPHMQAVRFSNSGFDAEVFAELPPGLIKLTRSRVVVGSPGKQRHFLSPTMLAAAGIGTCAAQSSSSSPLNRQAGEGGAGIDRPVSRPARAHRKQGSVPDRLRPPGSRNILEAARRARAAKNGPIGPDPSGKSAAKSWAAIWAGPTRSARAQSPRQPSSQKQLQGAMQGTHNRCESSAAQAEAERHHEQPGPEATCAAVAPQARAGRPGQRRRATAGEAIAQPSRGRVG